MTIEYEGTTLILLHYGRRYIERVGGLPNERDLDPVLARTLLQTCGDIDGVTSVLDAWFDSSDPWYANEGFQLRKSFSAMNRLYAQGDIQPRSGTSEQQTPARQLAIALFLKPELRIVRPGEP